MPEALRRPRDEADEILGSAIHQGEMLLNSLEHVTSEQDHQGWITDFQGWQSFVRRAFEAIYQDPAEPLAEFVRATDTTLEVHGENLPLHRAATKAGLHRLGLFSASLNFADFSAPPSSSSSLRDPGVAEADGPKATAAAGIFLVHGRDEAAKESVARFLDRVTESGVTILHEQADRGRTIIEKFEEHAAEAGYAVVLLTGDDEGRIRGEEELRPRARQNVILELGFFVGRLGRGKVALLYGEGVELPSDIQGVLFLPLDEGGVWKTRLAGEMLDAGVSVDPTKVLRA